jgi:hypothetical protein
MKLIAIMCVEELSDMARKLLQDVKVSAFSESEMKGYRLIEENESDNWFANKHSLDSSHLFFTMCDENKAEEILAAVNKCKLENKNNHVHAFQLNIEKFIG